MVSTYQDTVFCFFLIIVACFVLIKTNHYFLDSTIVSDLHLLISVDSTTWQPPTEPKWFIIPSENPV